LYFSPWNYPAAGTTGWGQIGYSATTNVPQPSGVPTVTMSNPFPSGLTQPTGSSLGLLTGTGGDITFIDPNKGAPRVQQYSVDLQRELPGGVSVAVGYTGLTGTNMDWSNSININQIDPKYQGQLTSTSTLVPNPFFVVAADGSTLSTRSTIEIGQLLRPYPHFLNGNMSQSTGAHSQYHAGILQLRKRVAGLWGGSFSYTYSRLNDNQWGETNYYSSNPGIQNSYEVIPGYAYYNPDLEYGRSLLDSPHKVVLAPTVMLPFGEGKKFFTSGVASAILGGWSITP